MQRRVRAAVFRGGTSRALIFHAQDLPADPVVQDRVLLAALGSPDPSGRQVDGLGGGHPLTNKVAIVERSTRSTADVDYTFAQVAVDRALVDRRGNCGNISSAIGPFAVDEGLVDPTPPSTLVRIHNTNTGKLIVAHVPTSTTGYDPEGDVELPGVPGTGSAVVLDFLEPGGAVTGALLPTGHASQELDVPGVGTIRASIVDAANPFVFVRLVDVATTCEIRAALNGDEQRELLDRLEAVRAAGAVAAGLADSADQATRESPAIPKLALVASPDVHRDLAGEKSTCASHLDLAVVATTMGRLHPAYQLTGAICTTVAAAIPETVVHDCASTATRCDGEIRIRIGHPGGVMEAAGRVARNADGAWEAERVSATRTARRIMDGSVYVAANLWA